MTGKEGSKIVVVGAGIVGVSTAIYLQRDGYDVTLVDRDGPAAGTSYGNGGVLASCAVVPVTVPGLMRKAPGLLFDPESPLFMRWAYLPFMAGWLRRYLSHCNEEDTEWAASALSYLLGDSLEQHLALAKGTGAERWIKPSDYIFVYKDRAAYETESFVWDLRSRNGFIGQELDQDALAEHDPFTAGRFGFGIKMSNHGHIRDPGKYVQDLAAYFEKQGGTLAITEARNVRKEGNKITALITGIGEIACDQLVLSAGAWSGPLAKSLGVNVSLESERGYHIELINPSIVPKSPLMVAAGKFVVTPMEGRIRAAGIVEFGGLKNLPSRAPYDLLMRSIERTWPELKFDRIEKWMGHRPATVDSIPYIGPTSKYPNAYFGFGHHHIGLTGGPKTGRILADLISGRHTNADLKPFAVIR